MTDSSSELAERRFGSSFDIAKSMRYHAYRRSFFDKLDKFTKILVLGTGGATFLLLTAQEPSWWARWLSLVLAVLTATDIIFGFSNNARIHDKLYRDFALLARGIAGTVELSNVILAVWAARRLEIEGEEPGIMGWLERRCCKEEAEARGAEVDSAWRLPGWKVKLSQFFPV